MSLYTWKSFKKSLIFHLGQNEWTLSWFVQLYRNVTIVLISSENSMKLRKTKQKYRGMFETQKSGNKTSSGEIGLDIENMQVPKSDRTRCPEE